MSFSLSTFVRAEAATMKPAIKNLQVSASLDRSTARLADALKMAENLSGAQGSDLVR